MFGRLNQGPSKREPLEWVSLHLAWLQLTFEASHGLGRAWLGTLALNMLPPVQQPGCQGQSYMQTASSGLVPNVTKTPPLERLEPAAWSRCKSFQQVAQLKSLDHQRIDVPQPSKTHLFHTPGLQLSPLQPVARWSSHKKALSQTIKWISSKSHRQYFLASTEHTFKECRGVRFC